MATSATTARRSADTLGPRLRLPRTTRACLFDLDGVLTDTAHLHAAAWRRALDPFLREHGASEFEGQDFERYVDGRPRADAVRAFLTSRGIHADSTPVAKLAERKNELVVGLLREQRVPPYPGSLRFLHAVRAAGLRSAVVSSSTNAQDVLRMAGLTPLVDAVIDGTTVEREGLHGKPAPDAFLAGARALGVEPAAAAVFEDSIAGVVAGRAGHFGRTVGVDRGGRADALREHGADVVVRDLEELIA